MPYRKICTFREFLLYNEMNIKPATFGNKYIPILWKISKKLTTGAGTSDLHNGNFSLSCTSRQTCLVTEVQQQPAKALYHRSGQKHDHSQSLKSQFSMWPAFLCPCHFCCLPLSFPSGFLEEVVFPFKIHNAILQGELPLISYSSDLKLIKILKSCLNFDIFPTSQ